MGQSNSCFSPQEDDLSRSQISNTGSYTTLLLSNQTSRRSKEDATLRLINYDTRKLTDQSQDSQWENNLNRNAEASYNNPNLNQTDDINQYTTLSDSSSSRPATKKNTSTRNQKIERLGDGEKCYLSIEAEPSQQENNKADGQKGLFPSSYNLGKESERMTAKYSEPTSDKPQINNKFDRSSITGSTVKRNGQRSHNRGRFPRNLFKRLSTKKKTKTNETPQKSNIGMSTIKRNVPNEIVHVANGHTQNNPASIKNYSQFDTGGHTFDNRIESMKQRGWAEIQSSPFVRNVFTLDIGQQYSMIFYFARCGKPSHKTKSKKGGKIIERRRQYGSSNNGPVKIELAGVENAKTALVLKSHEEVRASMDKRTKTGLKREDSGDRLLVCGEQIFASRYLLYNAKRIQSNVRVTTEDFKKLNKDIEKIASELSTNLDSFWVKDGESKKCLTPCHSIVSSASYNLQSLQSSHHEHQQISEYAKWYIDKYSKFMKDLKVEQQLEDGKNKTIIPLLIPGSIGSTLYNPHDLMKLDMKPAEDVVCVDDENDIYVCDIGLSSSQCDFLVDVTEFCSRGSYQSYTYAKQTLGCREYDELAVACEWPVMRAYSSIMKHLEKSIDANGKKRSLVLDDREPHMVKYDTSRFERQKLDMHTDKSEWTFLICLSNGEGKDFDGGGTYFEAIDTTVHLQKGHALIFPGKLRHRGQKIVSGTRFLLVGFLVEKSEQVTAATKDTNSKFGSSPHI